MRNLFLDDSDWLRRVYVDEKKTLVEIAALASSSIGTVSRALMSFGIPLRTPQESRKERGTKKKRQYKQLDDKELLRCWYENEQLSIPAIAERIGCSTGIVQRCLKQYGIKARHSHSTQPKGALGIAGFEKLRDPEWLRKRYHDDGLSMDGLAREIGCTAGSVLKAFRRYGIPSKPSKRAAHLNRPVPDELRQPDWLNEQHRVLGKSSEQIASELGCARGQVMQALRRFGISRFTDTTAAVARNSKRFPKLVDKDWLAAQYLELHREAPDIASELGCSKWAVYAALSRWRILKFPDKRQGKEDGSDLPVGTIQKDGYILVFVPDHPFANGKGYVPQHRLMVESAIGRYLDPLEQVHHVNEKRNDNRLENFILFPSFQEHNDFHKNPPAWIPRCECCARPRPELILRRPDDVPLVWTPPTPLG